MIDYRWLPPGLVRLGAAAAMALTLASCAATLEPVRPVQPAVEPIPELVWPDYVESEDVALLETAERDIDDARKGELLITVLGHDQFPAHTVEVEWTQLTHQFSFGVAGPFDAVIAGDLIRAGVNRGEVRVDWQSTEPQRGVWTVDETLAQWGGDILGDMGVGMVASGALLARMSTLPPEVADLSPEAFLVASQRHLRDLAERLKGRVSVWEAISDANLAAGGRLYEPDLAVRLAQRAVSALHEIDPAVPATVTFRSPLGEPEVIEPIAFLTRLADAGVEYDRIGLRIYDNGYTRDGRIQPRRSLPALSNDLDELKRFDREVDILGFAVPGVPSDVEPTVAGHWGRRWSPELQAVYFEAVLTLAFSKPHVTGITWTGASDQYAPVPGGGLFSAPSQAKPAFHALAERIAEWTTRSKGEVDPDGRLRFRGYGGQYRITVRDPLTGREVVTTARVRERELHKMTIVLPEELTYRPAPAE